MIITVKKLCPFVALLFLLLGQTAGAQSEEGQFTILVAGKEIGREKFSIKSSGESVNSSSNSSFRDPGNKKEIKIETALTMDSKLAPRTYRVQTNIGGQKVQLLGNFEAGEVAYQLQTGGAPTKSKFLVGENCSLLDNNVFHHFVFIARRFDFENAQQKQSLEVVIPQEMDKGVLEVSDLGIERVSIRGKERDLRHLLADSGSVKIDLWVDEQHVIHKIAMPAKQIEIIRS